MAFRISRLFGITSNFGTRHWAGSNGNAVNLVKIATPQLVVSRSVFFFNRKSENLLWKSATSVSNPGRKRGRSKNIMRRTNIYKVIGTPAPTMQFPGFSSPIKMGNSYLTQRPLAASEQLGTGMTKQSAGRPDFLGRNKIDESQSEANVDNSKAPIKMVPLRGWTSASIKGKKLGPPEPTDKESFEGFESWLLESRARTTMHPTLGRVKKFYACCVTGNGNGTAGFADVTAKGRESVIARGKSLAGQRLLTIDRYEDRTVMHDFFARFGNSKIIVKQAPAGYGLVCHRALKICCEAFGIKDIYAKSEGSGNVPYLVQAFFIALLKQKSFQEMAEDKKLHVVEFRDENYFFPKVLASPSTVRTKEEIPHDEILDFNQYLFDGKVPLLKKRPEPFYVNTPSYDRYLRKMERRRGQKDVRIKLKAHYGEVRSFLTEQYPEAKPQPWRKNQQKSEDAVES